MIERVNELVDEFQGLSIALTDQSLDHINDKCAWAGAAAAGGRAPSHLTSPAPPPAAT